MNSTVTANSYKMNSKIKTYDNINTLGMSQLDLVIKVYEGAISSFKVAAELYKAGNSMKGHEQLEKSKRFITHLYTTLDPEKGGEIAEKLGKIYAFLLNQTNLAQATKELKIIDDNITILSNIRDGWLYLKKQQKGEMPAGAAAHDSGAPKKFSTSA